MRLAEYSDRLGLAPARLRRLLEKDFRITGYTIEPDGVFIYTDSSKWCDDAGGGTFSGRNCSEAISNYLSGVRHAEPTNGT